MQLNNQMRIANFYFAAKIGTYQGVSYLPASVIYCHRLCEQLRSLQVNRERTPVINVKYIAETAALPEIEDSKDPPQVCVSVQGSIYASRRM